MSHKIISSRRAILASAATTVLLGMLHGRRSWANGRPAVMAAWGQQLVTLKDALRAGKITVTEWQDAIDRLNGSVPLADLIRYLDLDRLAAGFRYPTLLADVADPVLPKEIIGGGGMKGWFVRMFGLRKGGAIIPHIHNNMVSAHLVVSGSFHARTHDRIADLKEAVLLRPRLDGSLRRGGLLSMSDRRDNQHWLVALEDRAITFDVGVVGLPASWTYGLPAQSNSMIFVDPAQKAERDGTIVAPVISFEKARARFAS